MQKVGTVIADLPSTLADWAGEKYAMEQAGYTIIYDAQYADTQTDFTQNVIAMKNAGVKVVFLDQMPESYASALLKDLVQQNFHPQVVLGAATYSHALIAASGGPAAVNGSYLDQNASLYLGEDQARHPGGGHLPPLGQRGLPRIQADLFTLDGWLSAELFAQALKNAGPIPSRGSILKALSKITSFNGGNIVTTSDPATRTTSTAIWWARCSTPQWTGPTIRPSTARTHGYRCDYSVREAAELLSGVGGTGAV